MKRKRSKVRIQSHRILLLEVLFVQNGLYPSQCFKDLSTRLLDDQKALRGGSNSISSGMGGSGNGCPTNCRRHRYNTRTTTK